MLIWIIEIVGIKICRHYDCLHICYNFIKKYYFLKIVVKTCIKIQKNVYFFWEIITMLKEKKKDIFNENVDVNILAGEEKTNENYVYLYRKYL